jgi:signal transduction histidine kinase
MDPRSARAEKRKIILLLRWVLILAVSYLIVYSSPGAPGLAASLCVVVFLVSNLVLTRLPEAAFHHPAFDPLLVVSDIILITTALWLCGTAGPDLFFVFFFVLFLGALGERPELTAVGAVLAAFAYLGFLHRGPVWEAAILLRVPFLFVAALTYGYLAANAREARRRAQAAEEVLGMKRTFLATMSHEMRTPLNVIVGYAELLHEGMLGRLSPDQREGVAKMHEHAFELLELIDRTLKASRLESGALPVRREQFAVDALLDDVRIAVAPYERPEVALSFRAEPDFPPLHTDRLKLKEVVTNLVTNALKYTPVGSVAVDVRRPGEDGVVEVVVRDTGIGIPPDRRAEMFELFTRGPEADASCTPGVGLGLYIVRRLLDLLGGDIRVESATGAGSTFTVRVPRELAETADAA